MYFGKSISYNVDDMNILKNDIISDVSKNLNVVIVSMITTLSLLKIVMML